MSIPENYKFAFSNIWLSEKDFLVFADHTITEQELIAFFGEEDRDLYRSNLLEIANREYTMHQLRFDILQYNELFSDAPYNNKGNMLPDGDEDDFLIKQATS